MAAPLRKDDEDEQARMKERLIQTQLARSAAIEAHEAATRLKSMQAEHQSLGCVDSWVFFASMEVDLFCHEVQLACLIQGCNGHILLPCHQEERDPGSNCSLAFVVAFFLVTM